MNRNEFTVNVKNLIYRVLLKWRMILLFAVIFAVLGNCYGIYKSYKASKVQPAADLESQIADAKKAAESERGYLSASEAQDADNAATLYMNYQHSYDSIMAYMNASVLMRLDYDRVPTLSLRYYADDHFRVEYPQIQGHEYGPDIAASFVQNLLDDETLSTIGEKCGLAPEYAMELVDAGSEGNYVCIDIIGENGDQCREISEIIKERMQAVKTSNASIFPKYDLTLVADNFRIQRSESVYERQLKKINDCNAVVQTMADMQLGMTDREANYFALRTKYLLLEESGEAMPVADKAPGVSFVHKKFILLGFVGGAFIVILIAIISYVLTPVVRVKENLSRDLSQTVIGTIRKDGKKKFAGAVDRMIGRWFYGREDGNKEDLLCAGIEIAMEKEGLEKLYLTGTSDGFKEVKDGLTDRLSRKFTVECGESIVSNPDSLKKMSDSQAVVFVETSGESGLDGIQKELELAAQSRVTVLGFILVER